MRIIIYTGKGGVGKTSVASSTAVRLAKQGYRTIILSTDAAHSLSDSFDIKIESDPTQIGERLWGQEIDNLQETEKHWGVVQKWLRGMMSWAKLTDITTEEILVIPGMEELFSLMEIKRHAISGEYDAIIVDCAPTGETLRLLSYPDLLNWWLEKVFPHERRFLKAIRPVAKMVTGGLELPSDSVMDSIAAFVQELKELQKIIADPTVTSVRIVVNPEKMVIAEARRSFTYLNLSGFNTDAIIINRVLPPEAGTGFLSNWRDIHLKYEEEIRISFSPLPILQIPMMDSEVFGLTMLKRIGDVAFIDHDAVAVLYQGKIQEICKDEGGYALKLVLPFIQKDRLELSQTGDELTVQAGPYRRKVLLPRTLMGRPIVGARFTDQRLVIRFGDKSLSKSEKRDENNE